MIAVSGGAKEKLQNELAIEIRAHHSPAGGARENKEVQKPGRMALQRRQSAYWFVGLPFGINFGMFTLGVKAAAGRRSP
jgi:hypothetical protein